VTRIEVSTIVDAPPQVVWEDVSDLSSHVQWMADAESITFTTTRRHGVGTAFDCLTRVGPIRLTDKMVCTAWDHGRTIGIRHVGIVTGEGALTLEPHGAAQTRFTWTETLRFPVVLGGPLGGLVGGKLVLKRIWRKNLEAFAARFAGG
jgi:carbon monoxide dehydrogenase subunit G